MEYAAPLTILSSANIRLLQGVQYQALMIIYIAPQKLEPSFTSKQESKISVVDY
jgi:hypothetical protein